MRLLLYTLLTMGPFWYSKKSKRKVLISHCMFYSLWRQLGCVCKPFKSNCIKLMMVFLKIWNFFFVTSTCSTYHEFSVHSWLKCVPDPVFDAWFAHDAIIFATVDAFAWFQLFCWGDWWVEWSHFFSIGRECIKGLPMPLQKERDGWMVWCYGVHYEPGKLFQT